MSPHDHLALDAVSFTYPRRSSPALTNINLTVGPGELVGLVGPNGSGKSTLLKLIVGPEAIHHTHHSGSITIHTRNSNTLDPTWRAQKLSYMPQDIGKNLPFTVEEMVRLGRHPHTHGFWSRDPDGQKTVENAMERCGVIPFRTRQLRELSGGERQRVLLASCLAQKTSTLLLDEPTSALDLQFALQILEILKTLASDGLSVVMASHDLNLAARYCTRLVVLHQGKLVADGPPAQILTTQMLADVYHVNAKIVTIDGYPGPVVLPLGVAES